MRGSGRSGDTQTAAQQMSGSTALMVVEVARVDQERNAVRALSCGSRVSVRRTAGGGRGVHARRRGRGASRALFAQGKQVGGFLRVPHAKLFARECPAEHVVHVPQRVRDGALAARGRTNGGLAQAPGGEGQWLRVPKHGAAAADQEVVAVGHDVRLPAETDLTTAVARGVGRGREGVWQGTANAKTGLRRCKRHPNPTIQYARDVSWAHSARVAAGRLPVP